MSPAAHDGPVVIATKGGFSAGASIVRDFSEAGITKAARGSLKRLKRDTIELYMLHSPTVAQLENDTWPEGRRDTEGRGHDPVLRDLYHQSRIRHPRHRDGRRLPADRVRHARPDRRGRAAAARDQTQHRHHDPDAAGARPAERQVPGGRGDPGRAAVAPPDRRPAPAAARSASSSSGSWSATARRSPRRRCAGCWPSPASTASSLAPGPSSSSRPTSAPSTAT